MFRLVNTRALEFEATVPGEHAAAVRRGAPVRLAVSGWSGRTIEGVIARVNAAVDPATRQVKLYVSVPNPGGALVGGLYATGTVVTSRAPGALAVPLAALHGAGDSLWVMVVDGGKLAKRPVRTGVRDETLELVEITGGLAPGARVVRAPVEGLAPGASVTLNGGEH
jgi:RND family efflux transporter MFP subunit